MKLNLAATILRTFPLAIMLVCGLALLPGSAFADGPPDGKTPSKETV